MSRASSCRAATLEQLPLHRLGRRRPGPASVRKPGASFACLKSAWTSTRSFARSSATPIMIICKTARRWLMETASPAYPAIPNQDIAMWESMGPIADRTPGTARRQRHRDRAVPPPDDRRGPRVRARGAGDRPDPAASAAIKTPLLPGRGGKDVPWRTLGASDEEVEKFSPASRRTRPTRKWPARRPSVVDLTFATV